jgi:hypothetical protein
MTKFNDWFKEIFEDNETLRNIRSIAAASIALGLGALFFGLFNSDNLKALLTYNVAGLTIVAILSVWIWKIDLQDRAMADEIEDNKELNAIETNIIATSKLDRNGDHCMIFADNYNEQQQLFLNNRKTRLRINKYKSKIETLRLTVRDLKWYQHIIRLLIIITPFAHIKDIAYYEKQIIELNVKPLFDKSYKKISAKKILAAKVDKVKKETYGADEFEYNPKYDGTKKSLIFSFGKFAGIGGAGNMVFASSASGATIFIYYALLIVSLIWVTVSRYPKVRINTKTKYYVSRENKLKLMKKMIAWHPVIVKDTLVISPPVEVIING